MEASLLPAPSGTLQPIFDQSIPQDPSFLPPSPSSPPDSDRLLAVKRAASPGAPYDSLQSRKRMKLTFEPSPPTDYHSPHPESTLDNTPPTARDDSATRAMVLSHRLLEELTCGCCTELCYNPVFLLPCQHFFCGSCTVLWIRHGGRDCPKCRASISAVSSAHSVQLFIDVLLETFPSKARFENDRLQADEIYRAGSAIRLPPPREPTPEPNVSSAHEFVRPCRHCRPDNEYGWNCPIPVPDPRVDQDNAWPVERGCPPGHAWCGNCDELHSIHAPHSSRCDLCLVSFCGVGIPRRCVSLPLMAQVPEGLSELEQLLSCEEIVDLFRGNLVERDYLIDHAQANDLGPIQIYREILASILARPDGFQRLIEEDVFVDLYPNANPLHDSDPQAPRQRICRICASEVFIWGLKGWWYQQRISGHVDPEVMGRKDCPDGSSCGEQGSASHARQWNHFIDSEFKASTAKGQECL